MMRRPRACLFILILLLVPGPSFAAATNAPAPNIDLSRRINQIHVVHKDGHTWVEVSTPTGRVQQLTPQQYVDSLYHQQQQRRRNHLFLIFNITSWFGVVWVGLGLLGQVLFTGRMLVQWLASEKAKKSVVPVAFWWMSVTGATMLLLYFIWRKDIVGVLGQSTGWAIYVRNLWMIYRRAPGADQLSPAGDPAPEPELSDG